MRLVRRSGPAPVPGRHVRLRMSIGSSLANLSWLNWGDSTEKSLITNSQPKKGKLRSESGFLVGFWGQGNLPIILDFCGHLRPVKPVVDLLEGILHPQMALKQVNMHQKVTRLAPPSEVCGKERSVCGFSFDPSASGFSSASGRLPASAFCQSSPFKSSAETEREWDRAAYLLHNQHPLSPVLPLGTWVGGPWEARPAGQVWDELYKQGPLVAVTQ